MEMAKQRMFLVLGWEIFCQTMLRTFLFISISLLEGYAAAPSPEHRRRKGLAQKSKYFVAVMRKSLPPARGSL